MESTFVTVFLSAIGATNSQIGLCGMILNLSFALVPIFAAYMTARMPYKKGPTVWLQVIPSVSIILLGIYYITLGIHRNAYTAFVIFYSLFAVGIASTVPVWQNFIVKIFTPQNRVRGISIMMFAQNSAKLLSGSVLTLALGVVGLKLDAAGLIFFLSGMAFLVGSFIFSFAKENRDDIDHAVSENPVKYLRHYIAHILKNRNMVLYLLQDIEFSAAVVAITFYARYAVDYCGIPVSAAGGIFIIMIFLGAVFSSFLLGFIKKLTMKFRYWIIKICSIAGIALLILLKSEIAFLAASFLLGFSRSGRLQLYGPVVKGFSGLQDASPYYAIAPILMLPISAWFPIAMGFLLDKLSVLKAVSFQLGFVCLIVIVLLSLIPFILLRFPEKTDETAQPSVLES
jgi:MFS family permease